MGALIGLLSIVIALGCLVCLIIVLTKLFPAEGALKGILGIICALYTFIWGWMNKDRFGLQNIMVIWTILILISIFLNVIGRMMYSVSD